MAPLAIQTAPAKIFLDFGAPIASANCNFRELHEVTWSKDNATGFGIEYVRTAFFTQPAAMAVGKPRAVSPKQELLTKFLEWLTHQTPQRQIVGMAAEYASLAGNRKAEYLTLEWSHVDHDTGEIRLLRAKQRRQTWTGCGSDRNQPANE